MGQELKPLKIGIIRTSSIGDVVLATASLDYIRQLDPMAEVVWVGRRPTLSLIEKSWPNVTVVDLPSNASSMAMNAVMDALKQCRTVIDLQTNHRSRWMVRRLKQAGVPVFSADKKGSFRLMLVLKSWIRGRLFRYRSTKSHLRDLQYQMMLDAVGSAIKSLGLGNPEAVTSAKPRLDVSSWSTQDSSWCREMQFGRWLGVAAGASFPTKRAPAEVLKDILVELRRLWPTDQALPGIVFIGGPEDRQAAVELMDETHWGGPVLNLAGKLSLDDTAIAISKTLGLLTNDSGLSHIAEALGKPVAVLFGPTVEEFGFAPHGPQSAAYSSTLGCRPCSKHGKRSCRYGDKLCFSSIDTPAVARHLKSILLQGGLL
jgi:heptosyltransferase-2